MSAATIAHTIILVEIRCRYCNTPRASVPVGTVYVFRCCKLQQEGVTTS